MSILGVPLIAQWGTGANAYRLDCGPACVAMILAYYNRIGTTTVDQLARETALADGSQGLMPGQLVTLLARHLLLSSVHDQTTEADLRAQIMLKRPVIALIAYRFILGRLDQNDKIPGKDAHFVVVVGFDQEHFVLNDPDWWAPYTERGHDFLVDVTELQSAMNEYHGECVFMEQDMDLGATIADLARQIETLAGQINTQAPPPVATITIVVTSANGAKIRSTPNALADNSNKVGGVAAGSVFIVEQVTVKGADGRDWYRIAAGQFQGAYIAAETVGPKA